MMCIRCNKESHIYTIYNNIPMCIECCPLSRRCKKCDDGVLVYSPTPNDMGRMRCDRCKKIGHSRRVRL